MVAVGSYITHTVALPELIWTVVTGTGLYFNSYLAREAYYDLKALRKANINSIREYAAITGIIAESLKLLVQFTFFMLGVIAMCLPSANSHQIPTFQWVLTGTFVTMAFVITCTAFLERIRRKHLINLIMFYEDDLYNKSKISVAEDK